jgi:rhamnogalacturonyl hydrolase YesR
MYQSECRVDVMICGIARYEETRLTQYKTAADIFRSQLDSHPRTAQGQFWHKLVYPNQGMHNKTSLFTDPIAYQQMN